MGEFGNIYRIYLEIPEGGDHLEQLGVDRRIVLKWISVTQCERMCTGFVLFGIEKNIEKL
jgi:hypothetical protein